MVSRRFQLGYSASGYSHMNLLTPMIVVRCYNHWHFSKTFFCLSASAPGGQLEQLYVTLLDREQCESWIQPTTTVRPTITETTTTQTSRFPGTVTPVTVTAVPPETTGPDMPRDSQAGVGVDGNVPEDNAAPVPTPRSVEFGFSGSMLCLQPPSTYNATQFFVSCASGPGKINPIINVIMTRMCFNSVAS